MVNQKTARTINDHGDFLYLFPQTLTKI